MLKSTRDLRSLHVLVHNLQITCAIQWCFYSGSLCFFKADKRIRASFLPFEALILLDYESQLAEVFSAVGHSSQWMFDLFHFATECFLLKPGTLNSSCDTKFV